MCEPPVFCGVNGRRRALRHITAPNAQEPDGKTTRRAGGASVKQSAESPENREKSAKISYKKVLQFP
jgi:hypothetical protein